MLAWVREQPWFDGVPATCGASYLGSLSGSLLP
ncbi:MAG: hypothetical protein K0S98_903, partial [Propionibacteriaceae bacterium]|nr:hypothetical protein [Propionibacteriaceae bacterium]